ncbi:PASTA domain-containing protein [candidate division KSB1 bacterium]|nr:PASTA domain-containing protein [candidate division KSB1 bacterium]
MSLIRNIFQLFNWEVSKYILVPILLFLILFLIFNEIIMPIYTRHGQAVEVPNVVEMTYEGARTLMEQNDLEIVESAKKFDENYRAGIVISQNPQAFTQVKKGRRIYVIVSKGEPTVEIPRLIGLSEQNAIFEINRVKLELRNIHYEHSDHYLNGVVSDQSILAGSEVKIGEPIDIVVSLGRFPDNFIVPYLVGRSLNDANKVLQQAGLVLGDVRYEMADQLLPETIISQSIAPNTEVNRGQAIHVVVSKLPTSED